MYGGLYCNRHPINWVVNRYCLQGGIRYRNFP